MIKNRIHKIRTLTLVLLALFAFSFTNAQAIIDSSGQRVVGTPGTDTVIDSVLREHSPRVAATRSAIIPGWGQAYNKKYWKIPIVYGALGTTAVIFVDNIKWYNRFRYAYKVLAERDTANYSNVYPLLRPSIDRGDQNSLRYNRDEFRRNMDYSVLFFILFWGLNVVDATVDAHLKSFDVSPDLSFRFKAGYSDLAGTNGLSLVLAIK